VRSKRNTPRERSTRSHVSPRTRRTPPTGALPRRAPASGCALGLLLQRDPGDLLDHSPIVGGQPEQRGQHRERAIVTGADSGVGCPSASVRRAETAASR
jgi:hypothetical protein